MSSTFTRETLGDDLVRVQWRTKENLDTSYLMMYAHNRGKLYLQLEDDLTTVPNFVSTILEVAANKTKSLMPEDPDWFDIHFYPSGFIGILFRNIFLFWFEMKNELSIGVSSMPTDKLKHL